MAPKFDVVFFFKRKKLTRMPHLIERRQHTTMREKVTSEANSELLVNIFKKNLDFSCEWAAQKLLNYKTLDF